MLSRRLVVVAALACSLAAVLASTGLATRSATKQRIAIVVYASVDQGGSFEVIPLSPGPIKHDKGSVTLAANVKAAVVRGGLRVIPVLAVTTTTSKLGGFTLSQKIESVEVGGGYSSDRGTWALKAGTGKYAGVTGSGRVAAVGFPGGVGQISMRHEGFVTTG
jgi:hypothetical protein